MVILMPPKKYAEKGKPDFHNLKDDKLLSFMDLTQQLIFAYNRFDEAKVEVLRAIWKDLCIEQSDRVARSACEVIEKQGDSVSTGTTMLKSPKIRKSPAKRKI